MRIVLTSAAEAELSAAVDWYQAHAPAIVSRFVNEFDDLLGRIGASPRQFPVVYGDIRRAGFRHFPYGLFFHLEEEMAIVVACFHAKRDPDQWRRRT
jgi:plasmid stabilization system protein ParE